MDNWRAVLTEAGQLFINGNNIVLEHIETKEIGYMENTLQNRQAILGSNGHIEMSEADNEQLNSSLQCDGDGIEDEPVNKSKWNQNRSKLLIQKRLSKERDFNNPKSKKIKLWGDIAKDINTDLKGACTVNAVECDNKFRNLLKTYKVNKKKQKTTGEGSITWEFFTQFDEILGCKASIEPPANNLLDTLHIDDNQANSTPTESAEETVWASDSTDVEIVENKTRKASEKAKKNLLKFNEYLFLKNKREDEKRVTKESFEKKKWEEKELRKEEVSAILQLAEALAKKD